VYVIDKRAFTSFADADVHGTKSDLFTSRTLLIQVKHHQGTSGEWGIEQLEELKRLTKPEDPDFNLV
jgi:restriction system protein